MVEVYLLSSTFWKRKEIAVSRSSDVGGWRLAFINEAPFGGTPITFESSSTTHHDWTSS